MAKETFYFPHDYEPTADPKIQALIGEYGALGYGLYWRLVEMLHSEETHMLTRKEYVFLAIAKQMLTPVEQVKSIVTFCIEVCELFVQNATHFWSERVLRNIEKRNDIKEKRSEAGKKSALKRLENSTSVEQVATSVQQNPTKERKGKENKVKESKVNKDNNHSVEFERFWELYGKKNDRKKCEAKFSKLKPEQVQKIFDTLPAYLSATPNVKYRKNPATYLNNESWNDEIDLNPFGVDRAKHPDFPEGYPYTQMNIYYFEHNRIGQMEKHTA